MYVPIRTIVTRVFGAGFLIHVILTLLVFAYAFPGPDSGPFPPWVTQIREAYSWIGRGDMARGMLIAALVLGVPLWLAVPRARRR